MKYLKLYESLDKKSSNLYTVYRYGEKNIEHGVFNTLIEAENKAEELTKERINFIKQNWKVSSEEHQEKIIKDRFGSEYKPMTLYQAVDLIYEYAYESGEQNEKYS